MSDNQSARVMVVDDEPAIRELLVDALHATGLEVTAAGSKREAIDLANREKPDLLITDLRLSDSTGMDVVSCLRTIAGDIPTVVITGHGDPKAFSEASRCRPVEMMTKPLNLDRLKDTVREELSRRSRVLQLQKRNRKLRSLARQINIERKNARKELRNTCVDLASAYKSLSGQLAVQQVSLEYQRELIGAKSDDDVFRALFQLYVQRSGAVFGAAMVCDANAELNIVGRFGVPNPDSLEFCQSLCEPMVNAALASPHCMLVDAGEEEDVFDESVRKYLPGLTVLALPLIPSAGEMIGLVALYRKGEQPFTDSDVALAEMIALPTALAVRRND